MKKSKFSLLPLVTIILIIFCNSKIINCQTSWPNLRQPTSNFLLCNIESESSDSSHLITFAKAINYIKCLADSIVGLREMGWVEIPIDTQNKKFLIERCGMLAYFCYNPLKRDYFLCFNLETNLKDRDDPFPIKRNDCKFYKTEYNGSFDPKDLTDSLKIRDAIVRQVGVYNKKCDTIPYEQVNYYAQQFLNQVNNSDPKLPGILENPVGFFHKDQLDIVLSQSGVMGLRIYWGYSNEDFDRIKIIAFAYDKDGKNIVHKDGDNYILERSWPPYKPR